MVAMETRKVGKVRPFFEVKKIFLPRGSGVGDPQPTGWYWPAKCISERILHLNLFLNSGELFEMSRIRVSRLEQSYSHALF